MPRPRLLTKIGLDVDDDERGNQQAGPEVQTRKRTAYAAPRAAPGSAAK